MELNPLQAGYELFVQYKSRHPDPGKCKVITIDFEERRLSVTNGAVRLYPSFDEVVFVEQSAKN